jgi:hypothetical protein
VHIGLLAKQQQRDPACTVRTYECEHLFKADGVCKGALSSLCAVKQLMDLHQHVTLHSEMELVCGEDLDFSKSLG